MVGNPEDGFSRDVAHLLAITIIAVSSSYNYTAVLTIFNEAVVIELQCL